MKIAKKRRAKGKGSYYSKNLFSVKKDSIVIFVRTICYTQFKDFSTKKEIYVSLFVVIIRKMEKKKVNQRK